MNGYRGHGKVRPLFPGSDEWVPDDFGDGYRPEEHKPKIEASSTKDRNMIIAMSIIDVFQNLRPAVHDIFRDVPQEIRQKIAKTVKRDYDLELTDEEIKGIQTVGDVLDLVEQHLPQ